MIRADNIELRNKICELALLQYHKKYKSKKMGPDFFDCCGLVWYLYNSVCNINLYGEDIVSNGTGTIMTCNYGNLTVYNENDLNKNLTILNKGDILFFHRYSLECSKPTQYNKYF